MFNRNNKLDTRIAQLGGGKNAQGHALHFLERLVRADEDASRLALELYHKPHALRFVLTWVDLPQEIDRVAVSLNSEDCGPFVVAERDGKFVTCLGHGMEIKGLYLIRHSRLLALLHRYEKLEQGMHYAKQLKSQDLLGDCLERLDTAGMLYSREDLNRIAPLQPLLVYETFEEIVVGSMRVTQASQVLSRRHIKKRIDHDTARLFWQAMFGVSHNVVLFGMAGTRGLEPILQSEAHVEELWQALTATMWMNTHYHASRVIWLLGRLEGKLKRRYQQALWQPKSEMDWILGLFGTSMSLLKHEADTESVVRLIEKIHRKIPKYAPPVAGWLMKYLEPEFFKRLIYVLTDDQRALDEYCIPPAQEMLFEMLQIFPKSLSLTAQSPKDIPSKLALTNAMNTASEFMNKSRGLASLVTVMPAVSRFEAEDFYLPEPLAGALNPKWDPECTRIIIEREAEMWKTPSATTSKTVGRNALCPCGSGKKYKRCCLNK